MSVRFKLVVIILFVAIVPLTVSAWSTFGIHQSAFDANLAELHRKAAEHEATRLQAHLDGVTRGLRQLATQTISWPGLSPRERNAALWLVYRQAPEVAAAMLLDAKGTPVAVPAYVDQTAAQEEPGHPIVAGEAIAAFAKSAPLAKAISDQVAFGTPMTAKGVSGAVLPIAFGVPGAAPKSHWVVVAVVSLAPFCDEIVQQGPLEIVVVDGEGRSLCVSEGEEPLAVVEPAIVQRISGSETVWTYRDQTGEDLLAATAKLARGWRVIAQQPTETAYAASRRIRLQTVFWVALSLVVALAAGLFLARSISRPLERLAEAARQLAQGNVDHRVNMTEQDEFGRLGAAFDQMSDEIRAWNLELRERVEERTLELREAHQQLLRSEKAAATGTFSAGVASEMTDPLTSVLGIMQLLLGRARKDPARSRDVELLESAEKEALRIRAVVSRVRTLAQRQSELQFAPVRVNDLADSTLDMLTSELQSGGVEVVRAYGKDLPEARGNFTQLQQALLQVLSNSVNAVGDDARIVVSTLVTESGMLRIVVADNGCGIVEHDVDRIFEPFFTTGDASAGAGLGLSIAQRIIEEHHGTIGATSTRGEGTVVSIALPLATPEASASES